MKTLTEMQSMFAEDAFATEVCGIRISGLSEGEAICEMPVSPRLLNGNGVVQGGAIFTLCDTAFSVSANADGVLTVSQCASITYVRPATGALLTAVAQRVGQTRSTCLYRVSVYDDQQRVVAFMTGNGFRKNP